jgi:hypothetical protein
VLATLATKEPTDPLSFRGSRVPAELSFHTAEAPIVTQRPTARIRSTGGCPILGIDRFPGRTSGRSHRPAKEDRSATTYIQSNIESISSGEAFPCSDGKKSGRAAINGCTHVREVAASSRNDTIGTLIHGESNPLATASWKAKPWRPDRVFTLEIITISLPRKFSLDLYCSAFSQLKNLSTVPGNALAYPFDQEVVAKDRALPGFSIDRSGLASSEQMTGSKAFYDLMESTRIAKTRRNKELEQSSVSA